MLLRRDWEQSFPRKQADGWFHLVAYGSWALTTHEKELTFNQVRVSGIEMGHYRTF